jgi:hypothetical protein
MRRAAAVSCRRCEYARPGTPRLKVVARACVGCMASSFCAAAGRVVWIGGDFAEPALLLGPLEAIEEVGVDLLEPWRLSWVKLEEGSI